MIHAAGLLDSIVAYSTHAADFCNTINTIADITAAKCVVRFVPQADILMPSPMSTIEVSAHSPMMPPRALRFYGCQPSNFAGAGVADGDDYGSILWRLPSSHADRLNAVLNITRAMSTSFLGD